VLLLTDVPRVTRLSEEDEDNSEGIVEELEAVEIVVKDEDELTGSTF